MKIRVVNNKLTLFNNELQVMNMNYDMVVAKYEKDTIKLSKEDVLFIAENQYEEIILKCRDLLKIKLDKTMYIGFYAELVDKLEQVIDKSIKNIEVLVDKYYLIKKGLWEKDLILVINEEIPLEVNVIGKNYSKSFDIVIKEISLRDFTNNCCLEMDMLKLQIKEKQRMIDRYGKILVNVLNKSIKVKVDDVKQLKS